MVNAGPLSPAVNGQRYIVAVPLTSVKIFRLSTSLCTTLQPSHLANTEPADQPCGLTRLTLVVSHRLHVNFTCAQTNLSL